MQVVMCEAYGGPESLVVKSVASPAPGPGEVKIRLRARGVSFTDVLRIAGQYHVKTAPPFIPGGEAAGEIMALGRDVQGIWRSAIACCAAAALPRRPCKPAASVIKLPADVGFEAAAAFRSNYTTAYYAMQRGRLQPGETLLVHGAAGGVGLATVDMGKLMGARVIATARSAERLEVCTRLGADHVIDYSKRLSRAGAGADGRPRRRCDLRSRRRRRVRRVDAMRRAVRSHSDRRLHRRPAGRRQDQSSAGQGCRGDRLHHRRRSTGCDPQRARRNLEALVGWLGGRADPPLSFPRAAARRRPPKRSSSSSTGR